MCLLLFSHITPYTHILYGIIICYTWNTNTNNNQIFCVCHFHSSWELERFFVPLKHRLQRVIFKLLFTFMHTYLPSSIPSSCFFDLGLICVILHPPWWRSTNCLRTFPKLCRKSPWGYFSVHWVVVDDAKTDFHCVQGLTTFQLFFSRKASMLIWQSPNSHNPRSPSLSTHTCHSTRFK